MWVNLYFFVDNPLLLMIALFQVDSHNGWIKDIIAYNNLSTGFSYPIIADPKREVSMKILYGQFTIELLNILKIQGGHSVRNDGPR